MEWSRIEWNREKERRIKARKKRKRREGRQERRQDFQILFPQWLPELFHLSISVRYIWARIKTQSVEGSFWRRKFSDTLKCPTACWFSLPSSGEDQGDSGWLQDPFVQVECSCWVFIMQTLATSAKLTLSLIFVLGLIIFSAHTYHHQIRFLNVLFAADNRESQHCKGSFSTKVLS